MPLITPTFRESQLMLAIRQLDELLTQYQPNDAAWNNAVNKKIDELLDVLEDQGNPRVGRRGSALSW